MKRTEKDYDNWNKKKKRLNKLEECPDLQIGEIWRYYTGVNVGNEIGKGQRGGYKRVCLVLKNNLHNGLILIAPLSTKLNSFSAWNTLRLKKYDVKAWVILNQICLVDSRRFTQRRPIKCTINFVRKVLAIYKRLFSI